MFSLVNLEQIVFTLNAPLKGTNTDIVIDYIELCLIPVIVITILIYIVFNSKYFKSSTKMKISCQIFKYEIQFSLPFINFYKLRIIIPLLFLSFALIKLFYDLEIIEFYKNQKYPSLLYEEEYVDPNDVEIEFPEEKQNLIYIFVESLETSFTDKESGGINDENVIPELSDIALENINFSDKKAGIGGAVSLPNTTWTMGGLVAQTAGITLNLPTGANSTYDLSNVLPGVTTLGDILEKEGYKNVFLLGSEAVFGGRDIYFKNHGNYEILDYIWAKKEGKIPEDYYVWWGYEDSKLFEYAAEELEILSKEEEPFNLTLLTVDTHFTDGYVDPSCENNYSKTYSNAFACSSNQINTFLNWVKDQEFYDNTTIIISGDHLTMQGNYFDSEYDSDRRVYNAIINSRVEENNTTNRTFGTIDMFPTTLASLGVKIEGDRLGMGTNLFSGKKTLLEELGLKKLKNEFAKNSDFYLNNFVYFKKN